MTDAAFKNPVICAADTKSVAEASALVASIGDHVGAIKLGLEFFTANGTQGLNEIAALGLPIFLDLKFYDIPNTVYHAVYAATMRGVNIITIHASGGAEMMQAAAKAASDAAKEKAIARPIIVGVTVLTSMNQADLEQVGIHTCTKEQVVKLALLAKNSGLDGVVCSAHEIEAIKKACGVSFQTVVPGIRPEGSASNDQKRVMTPKEALDNGADFLVIGRPITQAESPNAAAAAIARQL